MKRCHYLAMLMAVLIVTTTLCGVQIHRVQALLYIKDFTVSPRDVGSGDTVTCSWWIDYNPNQEWIWIVNFTIFDPNGDAVTQSKYQWPESGGLGSEIDPWIETWNVPSTPIEGIYECKVQFYGYITPTFLEEDYDEFGVGVTPPEFDFDLNVTVLSPMGGINVTDLYSGEATQVQQNVLDLTVIVTRGTPENVMLTCTLTTPVTGIDVAAIPSSGLPGFTSTIRVTASEQPTLGSHDLVITVQSISRMKNVTWDLLVYSSPIILDFTPNRGWWQTPVTLTGVSLEGAQVFLGGESVGFGPTFQVPPPETIPPGSYSIMASLLGTGTSGEEFEVLPYPYDWDWGYNFHNPSVDNLAWSRFEDTFGKNEVTTRVCVWFLEWYCTTIKDPFDYIFYELWYEDVGETGTCYGNSVTSRQFLYEDVRIPGVTGGLGVTYFDSEATILPDLVEDDPTLTRVREFMHGSQLSLETLLHFAAVYGPQWSDILSERHLSIVLTTQSMLSAIDAGGSVGIVTIGEGSSGHAMVPYRYEWISDDIVRVYVYDSNREDFCDSVDTDYHSTDIEDYPFIEINTAQPANFNFEMASGAIWNDYIAYLPYSLIIPPFTIPTEVLEGPFMLFFGSADSQIEDEQGNRLGLDDTGELLTEIPDAVPIISFDRDFTECETYYLPPGDYNTHITGNDLGTYSTYMFVDGISLFGVEDAQTTQTTKDDVSLQFTEHPTGLLTVTTSDTQKEYSVTLARRFSAEEAATMYAPLEPEAEAIRIYSIKAATIHEDSTASFEVDSDFNSLTFTNDGPHTITYTVEFQSTIAVGDSAEPPTEMPTINQVLTIGPYESQTLTPSNWTALLKTAIDVQTAALPEPSAADEDVSLIITIIAVVAIAIVAAVVVWRRVRRREK